MLTFAKNLIDNAVDYYRENPAKSNAYIASAASAVLLAVGVTVDAPTLVNVLAVVVPIIIGGHKTHKQVTPV